MRDLLDNSTQKELLSSLRRGGADSGQYTGETVDLAGEGRKLLAILSVGKVATTTLTLTIQESSTTTASLFTTLYAFSSRSTTGFEVVDLTPTKQYVRAIASLSATNTYSIDFGLIGVVYNERYRPSNVT